MKRALMAIIERGEHLSSQRVVPDILEQDEIAYFEQMGFLHRGRDLEEVMCDCWDAEFCSIIRFNPNNKNSPPVRYCRHCGFKTLAPEDIQTWEVDTPKILKCLVEAAGFHDLIPEIPELTWSMGRCQRKNLCYVRNFGDDKNKKLFLNYYKNRPGTVFLTSQHFQADLLKSREVDPIINLEPFIEVDDSKIIFDRKGFLLAVNGIGYVDEKKKIENHQARRLDKIKALLEVLKEHTYAYIDLIKETKTETYSNIEILPRPTQNYLAKATHMSQQSVSSCLNDRENGKILHIFWDNLTSIEGVEFLRRFL